MVVMNVGESTVGQSSKNSIFMWLLEVNDGNCIEIAWHCRATPLLIVHNEYWVTVPTSI